MDRVIIPLTLKEKLECQRRVIALLMGFTFVLTIFLACSIVNVYRFKRLWTNEVAEHGACIASLRGEK